MLDYGKERCRIGRHFGEGSKPTILFLEQYAPGSELRWISAGPHLGKLAEGTRISWRYGPTGEFKIIKARGMTLEGFGRALSSDGEVISERPDWPEPEVEGADGETGMPQLDPDRVKGRSTLDIEGRGLGAITFRTGDLAPVYAAMNACMGDLVKFWGLDAGQQARRAQGPRLVNLPTIARLLQEDYPPRALRRGEQADLHLRAMVDAQGRVTDCALTNMTIAESFGQEPCQAISTRAQFMPAIDASGAGMPSYYSTRIRYIMRSGPDYTWPG